jgi:hypothetical protein
MNYYFKVFLLEFPQQPNSAPIPPLRLQHYRSRLPIALVDFWTHAGWSGYGDGILWSSDPEVFDPAVQAWLEQTGLLVENYTVIARNAFGELYLWGKKTGMSMIIEPLFGTVTNFQSNFQEDREDAAMLAFFASKKQKSSDFYDWKDKPLFKRALRKLGPLQSDEMYGFEPALAIGGTPNLEHLVKVKMVEHLVFLSQLGEVELVDIDVRRPE